MAEANGAASQGVVDVAVENWVQQASQSTRNSQIDEGGEKQGSIPTTIAETVKNSRLEGGDQLHTPRSGERAKRTFREYLRTSPSRTGEKRAKWNAIETSYMTVEEFRDYFQNVRDKKTLALYVFSVAYIPLRHIRSTAGVRCSSCERIHEFGGVSFCPRFSHGQPIFELHCHHAGDGSACGAVTSVEDMADAALDLLSNLTAEELNLVGLTTESVSDSEEGTSFRISQPLVWLGEGSTREAAPQVGAQDAEPQGVGGASTPVQPPNNEPQAIPRGADEELPPEGAAEDVLRSLFRQVQRMESELRQMREERTARPSRGERRRSAREKRSAVNGTDVTDWRSRAQALERERNALRAEVAQSRMRGLSGARENVEEQRRGDQIAAQAAVEAAARAPTRPTVAPEGTTGTGSPFLSDNRNKLPPELQRRLELAAQTLTSSRNKAPRDGIQNTVSRKYKALYFTDFEKQPARAMREGAQQLLEPEDKGVVAFVDFIGASVVEILVDEKYEKVAATALTLLEWTHRKGRSPLVGFATKYRSETERTGCCSMQRGCGIGVRTSWDDLFRLQLEGSIRICCSKLKRR